MENRNPFENIHQEFLVLFNAIQEHSLWPVSLEIPDGWNYGWGPATLPQCNTWLEHHWKSLHPSSFAEVLS